MITVWRIALDAARPPGADELAILSEVERARAARFMRDTDRNRWLRAHVATRRILGEALDVEPKAVEFGAGKSGKPFVSSPGDSGLEINLSDSGDLALLALSRVGPVGVDVEHVRPLTDMEAIAESHFAVEERAALLALPEAERLDGFYRLWTRKEAYIKALGKGLGHALDRFVVTIAPADVRFVHLDGDAGVARTWALRAIPVPTGYFGALAVRRDEVSVDVLDVL